MLHHKFNFCGSCSIRGANEENALSEIITNLSNRPEWLTTLGFVILVLVTVLAFIVIRNVLFKIISYATKEVSGTWSQAFLDKKLLSRASWIIPLLIFHSGVSAIPDLGDSSILFLQKSAQALLVIFSLMTLSVLLNNINKSYSLLEVSRNRPIKGILQLVSILLYAVSIILVFSIILDKSPWYFLSGLGAMTAILLLIFKDTILSLVAGIQITTNDFIRVGDWVEMPQFAADGDVVDIALHAVKVQNWDKTITIIPTHKFLENSYKNWRGMQDSGGRRIKRSVYIDIGSVRFLTVDEIDKLKTFRLLKDYLETKSKELSEANRNAEVVNARRLTNIGTFRVYLYNYLKQHPRIHKSMSLMVRQLSPSANGLPLQVYCFTDTIKWAEYENIQSDIFDHILAIAPEFGIRIFQEPTGSNFEAAFRSYTKL